MKKRMRSFFSCLLLLTLSGGLFAQYNDPNFPKPASGYGSDGNHPVSIISFTNPAFKTRDIEIYYPSDISSRVPTIFYSHAYGGNNPSNISGFLNFVASKGYAIVFVPYQTTGVNNNARYTNLLNGFRLAARKYPSVIDTTKVGFMGWSFGGGASFANAYKCFTENNWGSGGRFIYAMAQWYSLNISQEQLQSFPSDTRLLIEVFNDDETNDHRMAVDIFNTINIPASEKDYILLKSDTISGYAYTADHTVPQTGTSFDALDYYAIFRLFDALCDYTFNGSQSGKEVALGNGSDAQITMPAGMKRLVESDTPVVIYPQAKYLFPCTDTANARESYCPVISFYDIDATPDPSYGGTVAGTGKFTLGQKVTLKETPSAGFVFTDWTENGSQISSDAEISFVATRPVSLRASFLETTGISTINTGKPLVVYPNPTKGVINLDIKSDVSPFKVSVYDLNGKELFSLRNPDQIDLSPYPKGPYFLLVTQNGITKKVKVILR